MVLSSSANLGEVIKAVGLGGDLGRRGRQEAEAGVAGALPDGGKLLGLLAVGDEPLDGVLHLGAGAAAPPERRSRAVGLARGRRRRRRDWGRLVRRGVPDDDAGEGPPVAVLAFLAPPSSCGGRGMGLGGDAPVASDLGERVLPPRPEVTTGQLLLRSRRRANIVHAGVRVLLPRLGRREYGLEVRLGRLEAEAQVELPHEPELPGPRRRRPPLPGLRGVRQRQAGGRVLLEVRLDAELPADVARVGRRRGARLVRRRRGGAAAAGGGAVVEGEEEVPAAAAVHQELLHHLDARRQVQRQQLALVEELVRRRRQGLPPPVQRRRHELELPRPGRCRAQVHVDVLLLLVLLFLFVTPLHLSVDVLSPSRHCSRLFLSWTTNRSGCG
jgi:hypothetical protein